MVVMGLGIIVRRETSAPLREGGKAARRTPSPSLAHDVAMIWDWPLRLLLNRKAFLARPGTTGRVPCLGGKALSSVVVHAREREIIQHDGCTLLDKIYLHDKSVPGSTA
jgi:hypothetical protein